MNNTNLAAERYLTVAEEKQLFKTVNSFGDVYARRDAAWMQLLRQTGIRVGTMSLLTVDDAQQAINSKRLILRDEICKRQKGYAVPTNKKALCSLRKLLSIRQEMGHTQTPEEVLVMGRNHQRMSVRSYQDRLHRWREKAGLNIKVTPHFFRHTVGHRIMERSTAINPLLIVKSALGHSSINSSAVYTQPNREQIALDMEAIT